MFECFNSRAKKAMDLANRHAQTDGSQQIEATHILLGVIHQERCAGRQILMELDPESEQAQARLTDLLGDEPNATGTDKSEINPDMERETREMAEELLRINSSLEQIAKTAENEKVLHRQIEKRLDQGGFLRRIKRMHRWLHQSLVKAKPSSAAQRVMDLAIEEARLLGNKKVGTGHLLAGLLRDESGDTAMALIECGATLDSVRAGVRRLPEPDQSLFDDEEVSVRFTDRTKRVLSFAEEEAQQLHLDHIDTEHLLLGLLKEGRGVGVNVLKNLSVDLDKARTEVGKLTAAGPEPGFGVFLKHCCKHHRFPFGELPDRLSSASRTL